MYKYDSFSYIASGSEGEELGKASLFIEEKCDSSDTLLCQYHSLVLSYEQ